MGAKHGSALERFLRHVSYVHECWIWHGSKAFLGYNGQQLSVRRFVFQQYVGSIPPQLCVITSCKNVHCVNPAHLVLSKVRRHDRQESPAKLARRFWRHVEKTETCWLWKGKAYPDLYGVFRINNKEYRAHRISWTMEYGDIPPGMVICHHCDNPPCVRPEHLFLGTPQDNRTDAHRKKRHSHGKTHGRRKLDEPDVIRMRQMRRDGATIRMLKTHFPVGESTIYSICGYKSWRHLL